MTHIDYYFTEQAKYTALYGNKAVFLIQFGSFYEAYQTLTEGQDLDKISAILNIVVSKKNKLILETDRKNPRMMGFPVPTISKFMKILIDNYYTVILCDQVTPPPNPKREVVGIYSPGTYIEEVNTSDNNYILTMLIEENTHININKTIISVGLSLVDVGTGKCIIHEIHASINDDKISLDEAVKFINSYNISEILLISNLTKMSKEELEQYLEIKSKNYQHKILNDLKNIKGYKNICLISYQQELLTKIYPQINTLTPIEYLNLELLTYGKNAFIIGLQYIIEYNKKILERIKEPIIFNNDTILHLGNNAVHQLNILPGSDIQSFSSIKSLFDVIDETSTSMGRRQLKDTLIAPIIDSDLLEKRYNMIDLLIENNIYTKIKEYLFKISDIERLQRKIELNIINPIDLYKWITSQYVINELFEFLQPYNKNIIKYINIDIKNLRKEHTNIIGDINKIFKVDELQKYLINEITGNIFNKNIHKDIDEIENELNICQNFRELLANKLNEYIPTKNNGKNEKMIKVESTDRDGYYLSLTKLRSEVLEKELKKIENLEIDTGHKIITVAVNKLIFKHAIKGNTKIFLPELEHNSDRFISLTNKFKVLAKKYYVDHLNEINKFIEFNNTCCKFIALIDFLNSGAITAKKNRYTRPIIDVKATSYFSAKALRHPIIEKINKDVEYIPVDIHLGLDDQSGILLFGLNSAGKSTLQKAIGISVIMAQIGYFVAADAYKISPYKSLFTRISGNDNMFKGLSSFTLELNDLKAIIKRSGKNTLVIADEVCKGTEHKSSLIIVQTMIELLSNSNTSFISATHLHDLCKCDRLNRIKNVQLYHLHIELDDINKKIIYHRDLKKGSGSSFYGLEVAKYLMNDITFIDLATEIHKEIEDIGLVSDKKSKYNANIYMTECAICKKKSSVNEIPLESHHIEFQRNTDEEGFIINKKYKHKNHSSNLVVLCHKCHDKIDNKELIIDGYKNTSHGKKLVYNLVN